MGKVNEVLEDLAVVSKRLVIARKVEVEMSGLESYRTERRVVYVRMEELGVLKVLVDEWNFVDEEDRWCFL